MKEYTVDNDYAFLHFKAELHNQGIVFETKENGAEVTITMDDQTALRLGITSTTLPPRAPKALWVILIIISIVIAILLTGCGVPYKKLAQECAQRYPAQESVEYHDTIIRDTFYFPDYQFDFIDTTDCPPNLTDTLRIVKTVTKQIPLVVPVEIPGKEKTVYIRDTGREQMLEEELQACKRQYDKLSKRASGGGWKWAFFTLLAGVALFGGYTVFKRKV